MFTETLHWSRGRWGRVCDLLALVRTKSCIIGRVDSSEDVPHIEN